MYSVSYGFPHRHPVVQATVPSPGLPATAQFCEACELHPICPPSAAAATTKVPLQSEGREDYSQLREQLAAEDRYLPAGHVRGVQEVPNGHGNGSEKQERPAEESQNAHARLHRGLVVLSSKISVRELETARTHADAIVQTVSITPTTATFPSRW